jgi:hypothetical protein
MFTYGLAPVPAGPPIDPKVSTAFQQQTPTDDRWYGELNIVGQGLQTGVHRGGITPVVFDADVVIDAIGVHLISPWTGATAYSYRLGIYAPNTEGTKPSALIEDLGTLSISNPTSAGIVSLPLLTPYELAAGETLWVAVGCENIGAQLPFLVANVGHMLPYANEGVKTTDNSLGGTGAAWTLSQSGASALPSTYSVPSTNAISSATIRGYVHIDSLGF